MLRLMRRPILRFVQMRPAVPVFLFVGARLAQLATAARSICSPGFALFVLLILLTVLVSTSFAATGQTMPVLSAALSPAALIPPHMVLPSHWGVIKFFLLLTFFVHLLVMNTLLGSLILAVVNSFKAFKKSDAAGLTSERSQAYVPCDFSQVQASCVSKDHAISCMSRAHKSGEISLAPGLMSLTINFGVAPMLFAQIAYGSFFYSSSILMAVWLMSVPFLVMFIYYALYIAKAGQPAALGGRRLFLSLIVLLLLFVAFIFVSNNTLMLRPERWFAWFATPGGSLLNFFNLNAQTEPSLLPRYLHFILASLAVGGLFLALRGWWVLRTAAPESAYATQQQARQRARITRGLSWFFWASLFQVASGLWFLFSLPTPVREIFLGGNLLATFALALATAGMIAALVAARAGLVRLCLGFTLGVIFIMVCLRDFVREAMLAPFNTTATLPLPITEGQNVALMLFVLFSILGLLAIVWIIRISLRLFASPQTLGLQDGSGSHDAGTQGLQGVNRPGLQGVNTPGASGAHASVVQGADAAGVQGSKASGLQDTADLTNNSDYSRWVH